MLDRFRSWISLLPSTAYNTSIGVQDHRYFRNFLINHPSLVDRVLRTEYKQFPKHQFVSWLLKPLIGRASFSLSGEEWNSQRSTLGAAIASLHTASYLGSIQAAAFRSCERITTSCSESSSLDISEHLTFFAADVILRVIFSRPISDSDCHYISERFSRYQRSAGYCLPLAFLGLPTSLFDPILKRNAHQIRTWLGSLIDAYEPMPGDVNLISILQEQNLSRDALLDQICMFFLAGHETTAVSLSFFFYLLAVHQDEQVKVFNDLNEVCWDLPLETLPQTLDQLHYAKSAYMEALRLYPPLPFLLRESSVDTSFAGTRCPFKSMINISPWTIHRHHRLWSNPQDFLPSRFLDNPSPAPGTFIPFGFGPRSCPGAQFAVNEALIYMSVFLQRWKVTPDPVLSPQPVGRLTLRSSNGVHLYLHSRNT